MTKLGSGLHKILIVANFGMLLAAIIISFASIDYINQENLKAGSQLQETADKTASEILAAGDIGEVEKTDSGENVSMPQANTDLPQVVANVSGVIKEVRDSELIIKGDGVNFEDNVIRDLNAVFSAQTVTFVSANSQVIKYAGLDGLRYLKIGDNILIEGAENLRGKTEFKVKTVNILQ